MDKKTVAEETAQLFITKTSFNSLFNLTIDGRALSEMISPDKALLVDTYKGLIFACIDVRAEAVSLVEWKLKHKGKEVNEEDNLYNLLKRPNPYFTWTQFAYAWQTFYDMFGEVYIYIVKSRVFGVPKELWLLPSHLTKPVYDTKDPTKIVRYEVNTVINGIKRKFIYTPEEVVFYKNLNPKNSARGIGRLELALLEIDIHNFSKVYVRNFYKNGAIPQGILTTDRPLTDTEIERLRRQWEERYGGSSKAWKVAILSGGLKYEKISVDPASADFIKQSEWSRDDILSIFKVPPIKLGILTDSNKANSEIQSKQFARDVVAPNITRMQEFMNYVLFPAMGLKHYKIEFKNPIPEDEEINVQKAKVSATFGVATVNEIRKFLGLEPLEGEIGDYLVEPLNLPSGRKPKNEEDDAEPEKDKKELEKMLEEYVKQMRNFTNA